MSIQFRRHFHIADQAKGVTGNIIDSFTVISGGTTPIKSAKQTALGVTWVILQPVVSMVVFTFLFGNLLGVPSGDVPYPITIEVRSDGGENRDGRGNYTAG